MDLSLAGDKKRPRRSSRARAPTTVGSFQHDILCIIFSLLDCFDLASCSVVCKSWSAIINNSKLLQLFYRKKWQTGLLGSSNRSKECPEESWKDYLEEMAVERHRLALQEGRIRVDHLRGHSVGGEQCRTKMGLLLTGVGDKIVGLVGTRICIWRQNGIRRIFPSHEGTFSKGLCMRYCDPEAVVGCEDGTVRVFDMYSRKCSQIIRAHEGPVKCLCLSDDQLILSGSSLGDVTLSALSSGERVVKLRSQDSSGIKTLCFNPCSHQVFAGTATGYGLCWDLRMGLLWKTRVSQNSVYSMQHQRNDASTLAVGGIDGVLRLLNQSTGEVISRCILDGYLSPSSQNTLGATQRTRGRRLSEDTTIDSILRSCRPPITCLAVGMKKVITTHNSKYIRIWKFD
ncbi:PREDICTED: F-box/WD-40 repeat-containing protein At3g52030 isoform X2 [Prunus mume]|uniref:F-box/WD-40 repeat-containing protein At3g52030 isoform X2 n=1 Tax=Prunus mume TaxID=102107 RepID=A0ABM0NY49_PRUMU|nr:PREDICTED: F-box/WD-40 repeat-containing protein At3g52030 isoform X2 [Prunus mume]